MKEIYTLNRFFSTQLYSILPETPFFCQTCEEKKVIKDGNVIMASFNYVLKGRMHYFSHTFYFCTSAELLDFFQKNNDYIVTGMTLNSFKQQGKPKGKKGEEEMENPKFQIENSPTYYPFIKKLANRCLVCMKKSEEGNEDIVSVFDPEQKTYILAGITCKDSHCGTMFMLANAHKEAYVILEEQLNAIAEYEEERAKK